MWRFLFLNVCIASQMATSVAWAPTVSYSWTTPKQSETAEVPKVSGHACCDMGDGERLFLFGGLQSDRTATNDAWMFNGKTWKKLEDNTKGRPGPRMYVTASRLGNSVFVVGGWDPEAKGSGGTFKDDIYSMDTQTLEWTKHAPLPCGPVSRHTACTVGSQIVIHTFKEGDEAVLVLEEDGTCRTQPTTGNGPVGISMCSAVALGSHHMVVHGGSTRTQAFSEHVYLLDTDTWKWTRLESRGEEVPTARSSSCMVALDDCRCLVFGGAGIAAEGYQGGMGLQGRDETWMLRVLDDTHVEWTRVAAKDKEIPSPRVAATLNSISDKRFLLTGGWNPATAETYDAPWVLESN